MTRQRIGVLGGGLMGHGIAYLFAAAGHPVSIFEPAASVRDALPTRLEAIRKLLDGDTAILPRIAIRDRLADAVIDADVVIEAVPEKLDLKQKIFAEVEALVAPDTILASNSSALRPTDIGRDLVRRDRMIGTHFWNPPHLVPLVEVIETEVTSAATVEATMRLMREAGKKPVHVRRDVPGFIGNRLQHALKREAIALLADGVADAATIDEVVKEGFGARLAVLGPLEQSDLVGLELTLDIHETLLQHLDCTKGPHPLLRQKVAEGKLGMKAGEGFRRWTEEEAEAVRTRLSQFLATLVKRAPS
ncbi:MAG: 3-hydroxyacyl-CoA dehydrogenase NAD-binding domain-containing protein [Rhodoplanes sp.]